MFNTIEGQFELESAVTWIGTPRTKSNIIQLINNINKLFVRHQNNRENLAKFIPYFKENFNLEFARFVNSVDLNKETMKKLQEKLDSLVELEAPIVGKDLIESLNSIVDILKTEIVPEEQILIDYGNAFSKFGGAQAIDYGNAFTKAE